ncbi:MAG: Ig-like domain-containing protein [Candidatus Delongbacteria bacterium]|jgi:outer membrane protein OmpA-like peptidoglycan-associated protein|nr:Ig-like domain-containing protein [Candidatus Delongbacteria bacterium]
MIKYLKLSILIALIAFLGSCASTTKVVQIKDTTPPFVTLTVPYHGTHGVELHTKIRVAFSEPVDVKTVNSKTFEIFQGESLELIYGDVLATSSTSATFTIGSYLTPNTTYVGKISNGVKDIAGNALSNNFYWSFKTVSIPDTDTDTLVKIINKLVMLKDTHFKFNDATLNDEGKEALNTNIKILKDNLDIKVRIAGYTSAAGTEEYNQELSERRANTVVTYLYEQGGIKLERLEMIGYGETRSAIYEPIPEDVRSEAALANMRVLFEVIVK